MPTPRTIEARKRVSQPVALAIAGVKESLNTGMIQIGQMLIGIAEARMDPDARMPLSIGADAVDHAVELLSATSTAYRKAVIAHGALSIDKADLGLKTVAWGDWFPTPTTSDLERIGADADLVRAFQDAGAEPVAQDAARGTVVGLPGRVAA
ncbi:hypothetical protein HZF05_01090 [Sphingomonas sp. CGMCC 1.13654]|uniref:Uncharacterized protein n=1 Tax=Sphingomonas chungangi TaxID=2683589 RepID=A0A838L4W4_9SPHN|nr:hypothetical protein [Sphingomonas chungangi]MBA2932678.1 hypothetical protein [Sphingomonas chungangi]MVW56301.1 hypothetical protein [Sphingomonas chungangi]